MLKELNLFLSAIPLRLFLAIAVNPESFEKIGRMMMVRFVAIIHAVLRCEEFGN